MKLEKQYTGTLNVLVDKVSIDTRINYRAIEILYIGTMKIKSLLSDDYIIRAGNGKIIILKFALNDNIESDLFKYKGMAMLTRCTLIDENTEKINIYVNKQSLQLWNTLSKKILIGADDVQQDWAYLTINWEDINFDGKNNKKSYIKNITSYDRETGKYTTIKEIRKK